MPAYRQRDHCTGNPALRPHAADRERLAEALRLLVTIRVT
jgi:hypothetical protein